MNLPLKIMKNKKIINKEYRKLSKIKGLSYLIGSKIVTNKTDYVYIYYITMYILNLLYINYKINQLLYSSSLLWIHKHTSLSLQRRPNNK